MLGAAPGAPAALNYRRVLLVAVGPSGRENRLVLAAERDQKAAASTKRAAGGGVESWLWPHDYSREGGPRSWSTWSRAGGGAQGLCRYSFLVRLECGGSAGHHNHAHNGQQAAGRLPPV